MMMQRRTLVILLATALAPAFAQNAALPAWDALTPTQREQLIGPLRERWNEADADERQRMWQRAQRWHAMPPEHRRAAHRGMGRFERMDPQLQAQMRVLFAQTRQMAPAQRHEAMALFYAMRDMTPAQREALKQRWTTMTPAQRRDWLRDNAPPRPHRPDHPPRGGNLEE